MAEPRRFWKYHALGNDYLVLWHEAAQAQASPPTGGLRDDFVRALCHRHTGIGADGALLLGPAPAGRGCEAAVAIYNADGTCAERSGNGLRIAAQALWDQAVASGDVIGLFTATGPVRVRRVGPADASGQLEVAMGAPFWGAPAVGAVASELVGGADPRAPQQRLQLLDEHGPLEVAVELVRVGNPHAVWWVDVLDPEAFTRWAPRIARHAAFPRGINVQMAACLGPGEVSALVHERGSGPTLASGSSASAVAASAWRRELAAGPLVIRMPGGNLHVTPRAAEILLAGPVRRICCGEVDGFFDQWQATPSLAPTPDSR